MLIPLAALAASRLSEKARKRSDTRVNRVRIERDSHNRPWLVATDGRLLMAFTWNEPEENADHILKRCAVNGAVLPAAQKATEKRPGFACEIPSVLAAMLYLGGEKGELGARTGVGSCRWLALVEDEASPVLYCPQDDAVLTIMASKPRAKMDVFPSWRVIITRAVARQASAAAVVTTAPGLAVQKFAMRPELTYDMVEILEAAGLDVQQFISTVLPTDKPREDHPLLFHAWNYDHKYNHLQCTGAIMPLTSEIVCEVPLWVPASLQAVPAEAIPAEAIPAEAVPAEAQQAQQEGVQS